MFGQGDMAMPTSTASPSHSSADEFEAEDESLNHLSATHWHSQGQSSPGGTDPNTPQLSRSTPLQKRRRVTRACDECRRKKIKCDGKQPCTHCTVYSYGMTTFSPIVSMITLSRFLLLYL